MPIPRSKRPWDLVLFDLDGTLVDTAPDIADAVNAALAEHGLPRVGEHWVRDRIGHGTRQLVKQAASGDPEPILQAFHRHYAAHCGRRGRLYPEAAATLNTLRNAGVKLALVTNKEEAFARFVLEVHGLDTLFDVKVCGDTLPVRKPDAAVVQHCLDELRIVAARALLVGDSDTDVRAARNAGIAVWAVGYGYNHGRPIETSQPDRVIGALRELLEPLAPAIRAVPAAAEAPALASRYVRRDP